MTSTTSVQSAERHQDGQAGFSLIEVLIAIMVMVFGIMAIANLILLATASNSAAHQASIAATVATERMEELRQMPLGGLPLGDTVTWYGINPPTGPPTPRVPDGSLVQIFTRVTPVAGGPANTFHIMVTAIPLSAFNAKNPLVLADPANPPITRSGATFTMIRN